MVILRCFGVFCAGVLLGLAPTAPAQETSGSYRSRPLAIDTNNASIRFDRLLNTYRWNGNLFYTNRWNRWAIALDEQFRSSLIRTDKNLITDEQTLNLGARYTLSDRLQASWRASSFLLSDDKGIGISNASSHAVYAGFDLRPIDGFSVEPLIGARFDNQIQQYDHGASYLLNLSGDSIEYAGYRQRLEGSFEYDKLDPRTLESRSLQLSIGKTFVLQTRNMFQFLYGRNRRDFYVAADSAVIREFTVNHNIETRLEDSYGFGDSLRYSAGRNFEIGFQGTILARSISRESRYRSAIPASRPVFSTSVDELRMEGGVDLSFSPWSSLSTIIRFLYQERDEQHQITDEAIFDRFDADSLRRVEERKNNHSRRTSFSSAMLWYPSASDTIGLSSSGSLLRYDTPSLTNVDDRDELWYLLSLVTAHRINQYLGIRLSVDVNLTHIVYLSGLRSADNTWNRIARLSPTILFQPAPWFWTVNRFEVLANYTVYDFEYPGSSIRSYSFRQFAYVDSSLLTLSRKTSVEWTHYIRLYERGDLRWSDFAERPLNSFEDKTFSGSLLYNAGPGLLFSVGIRYFSQLQFAYNGSDRVLERSLRSVGPTTSIRWDVGSRTGFFVRGWYEFQSQTGLPDRTVANMTLSLTLRI